MVAARDLVDLDPFGRSDWLVPHDSSVLVERVIAALVIAIKDAHRFVGATRDTLGDLPLPEARIGRVSIAISVTGVRVEPSMNAARAKTQAARSLDHGLPDHRAVDAMEMEAREMRYPSEFI